MAFYFKVIGTVALVLGMIALISWRDKREEDERGVAIHLRNGNYFLVVGLPESKEAVVAPANNVKKRVFVRIPEQCHGQLGSVGDRMVLTENSCDWINDHK